MITVSFAPGWRGGVAIFYGSTFLGVIDRTTPGSTDILRTASRKD